MRKNQLYEKKSDITKLLMRPLKVSFLRKNFIQNFDADYEEYLTELINSSRFVRDNKNQIFRHIKEQSHNECDATNGIYDLEYKLLIDSKTMENMYYYSNQIAVDNCGVTMYSGSKKNGEWKKYFLLKILRGKNVEDFEKIENTDSIYLNEYELLIKKYLSKIKVNKNVIFFLPYDIFFKNLSMDRTDYEYIGTELSKDLKGFLEYRNKNVKDKDTYISFISGDNIVFYKYDEKLSVYDVVNVNSSKLYTELTDINDIWS